MGMTKNIHLHSIIICFGCVHKKQRNIASILGVERLQTIRTEQHEKETTGDIDHVQQNEQKSYLNLFNNQVKNC